MALIQLMDGRVLDVSRDVDDTPLVHALSLHAPLRPGDLPYTQNHTSCVTQSSLRLDVSSWASYADCPADFMRFIIWIFSLTIHPVCLSVSVSG